MAKFFAQMFSWVATDVIVKGLSNSRTFQRVVLKVDKFQSTAEKLAEEKATEAIKMAQEASNTVSKLSKEKHDESKQKMIDSIDSAKKIIPIEKIDNIHEFGETLQEQLIIAKNTLKHVQNIGDYETAGKLINLTIPKIEQEIKEINNKGISIGGVNVAQFFKHLSNDLKKDMKS